jgi:hypothetical protein
MAITRVITETKYFVMNDLYAPVLVHDAEVVGTNGLGIPGARIKCGDHTIEIPYDMARELARTLLKIAGDDQK